MVSVFIFSLAVLCAACQLIFSNKPKTSRRIIEVCLLNLIFFSFGFSEIIAFIGHIFFPDQLASLTHWPKGTPFQYQVGIAHLSLGLISILAVFFREGFWGAVIVANTTWLWGNATLDLCCLFKGEKLPKALDMYLGSGIVIPFLALCLFLTYLHMQKKRR